MKARAAILKEFNQPLEIETVEVPEPQSGDVLLRVRASGLCGSDIHIQQGKIKSVKTPYTPGHEMAGEIVSMGAGVRNVKPGDHVVCHIDLYCKTCRFCRTGRMNICPNLERIGFEKDGSHQEYVVLPAENVYKVADSMPFEHAAIIPDAISCTYHAIKEKAKVRAGDRILVLGVGGLGYHEIQIAKYFGAEVYATSRKNAKLDLALEFGADAVINTKENDLREEIAALTGGELCDVVLDNIGIETTIQMGIDVVRPGGKVIIVGYETQAFTVDYQSIMKVEKEIIGIRGSTAQEMMEVIRLVEKGMIKPYVYKTYTLDQINQAMTDLKEGRSPGRTVIMM